MLVFTSEIVIYIFEVFFAFFFFFFLLLTLGILM